MDFKIGDFVRTRPGITPRLNRPLELGRVEEVTTAVVWVTDLADGRTGTWLRSHLELVDVVTALAMLEDR